MVRRLLPYAYALLSVAVIAAGLGALAWTLGIARVETYWLIFILLISNDRRIMSTVNNRWQNFWLGAAAGGTAAAGLIYIRYALF